MKKAFMLAGLVLCTTMGFAAETRDDLAAAGKKRNEDAYERMLEQTGWKNQKLSEDQKSHSKDAQDRVPEALPSKSS